MKGFRIAKPWQYASITNLTALNYCLINQYIPKQSLYLAGKSDHNTHLIEVIGNQEGNQEWLSKKLELELGQRQDKPTLWLSASLCEQDTGHNLLEFRHRANIELAVPTEIDTLVNTLYPDKFLEKNWQKIPWNECAGLKPVAIILCEVEGGMNNGEEVYKQAHLENEQLVLLWFINTKIMFERLHHRQFFMSGLIRRHFVSERISLNGGFSCFEHIPDSLLSWKVFQGDMGCY